MNSYGEALGGNHSRKIHSSDIVQELKGDTVSKVVKWYSNIQKKSVKVEGSRDFLQLHESNPPSSVMLHGKLKEKTLYFQTVFFYLIIC